MKNEIKIPERVPHHIAIIMDGNGRWAKQKGLAKIAGHRAGADTVDRMTEACREWGVKVLTLYAFSTENWRRPKEEVGGLFRLLEEFLDKNEAKMIRNHIRLSVIGKIGSLPSSTQEKIRKVLDSTGVGYEMTLNIALNYGGRAEIVEAARTLMAEAEQGIMRPESLDENIFSGYLYTKALPDPELLIRTSGEMRISNFLLWQIAYSELYITKILWPDFSKQDLADAIEEYWQRERRYGG